LTLWEYFGGLYLCPTVINSILPPKKLLLGLFHGVPMTKKSVFELPAGPDYVVLYQKNIEAVCSTETEIRAQIRRTVIHEFGHYFGMDEEQL
jgi:predicted Zn-dependent protease with MMP-like domain